MTTNPATTEGREAWGPETRLVHSLRPSSPDLGGAHPTQSYVYARPSRPGALQDEAGFI
jgi:hypothetical protein